jgi:hypothetical protein
VNFVLLLVVALVLMSGIWKPAGIEIAGTHVGLPGWCAIWAWWPWCCCRWLTPARASGQ